jgi:hypothetical protein
VNRVIAQPELAEALRTLLRGAALEGLDLVVAELEPFDEAHEPPGALGVRVEGCGHVGPVALDPQPGDRDPAGHVHCEKDIAAGDPLGIRREGLDVQLRVRGAGRRRRAERHRRQGR